MGVIMTGESGNRDKSITKVVKNMTHAKLVPMIVENDVGSQMKILNDALDLQSYIRR